MQVNVSTIKGSGEQLSLHVFRLYEGQEFSIPDNSQVLYRSIVSDDGPEYLELWVGIPKSSVTRTTNKPRQKETEPTKLPTVSSNPIEHMDSFVAPENDDTEVVNDAPMFKRED